MSERDDMLLPDGKSCADCISFQRCRAFIGARHINDKATRCDFGPSRFRARVVEWHDDKDDRAHRFVTTGPGDLDCAGRPLRPGS